MAGVLVIDAEGYYGTYATVYATAPCVDLLPASYRRFNRARRIVSDGGFPRAVGSAIHREFAAQYRSAS